MLIMTKSTEFTLRIQHQLIQNINYVHFYQKTVASKMESRQKLTACNIDTKVDIQENVGLVSSTRIIL